MEINITTMETSTMFMETDTTTNDNHLLHREFSYIMKSENDDRLYKILVLNNHMKVLLISDPTTDKGAAALDVNIGNLYYILLHFAYRAILKTWL